MLEEKGWTAKLHQDGERGFHHLSQMLSCLGRRWGPQEEWCNRGGGHYQRPTFTGSTSQAGHPEGTIWALSTRPGAVGTPGNTRVLTPASATDIYPGDGHKYENTMLLPKRSILAPVLGREGRGGSFLCNCRACSALIMLWGQLLLLKTICRASTNAHPVKQGVLQEGLQGWQFIAAALVASSSKHYSVNIVFSLEKHLQ